MTCWWASPSWPGSWRRPNSPVVPWSRSSSGIGLNVAWPGPEGAGGTCLDDVGTGTAPVDRRVLLDHLLGALAPRVGSLDDAGGRRGLADEVRQACATLGQRVRVAVASEEFTGMAAAIDDAGRLVVETGSGPRLVTAGDVVHLRPG